MHSRENRTRHSHTCVGLLHDETSVVTNSWSNVTFFVEPEVADARTASRWKFCCYHLVINMTFRVQREVIVARTTSRWKVYCYYLVTKQDFFRSAIGRRRSHLTMKSLLLLPLDETRLFFCRSAYTLGLLRTQKLKTHLLRTQSSTVLSLKPGVGQYVAMLCLLSGISSLLILTVSAYSPAFFFPKHLPRFSCVSCG